MFIQVIKKITIKLLQSIFLTQKKIQHVRSAWAVVLPIQKKAGVLFYDNLFEIEPKYRVMFTEDIRSQNNILMEALDKMIKGLDDLDSIIHFVEELGRQHHKYGIQAHDYKLVSDAIMVTLEQCLGDSFTKDVQRSCQTVYNLLARTMINAT